MKGTVQNTTYKEKWNNLKIVLNSAYTDKSGYSRIMKLQLMFFLKYQGAQ